MKNRKPLLILMLMLFASGLMLRNSPAVSAQSSAGPVCIKDNANPALQLSLEAARRGKAKFIFRDCAMGVVVIGTASVSVSGDEITYTAPGMTMVVNVANQVASGSMLYLNSGPVLINDVNTANSICNCQPAS